MPQTTQHAYFEYFEALFQRLEEISKGIASMERPEGAMALKSIERCDDTRAADSLRHVFTDGGRNALVYFTHDLVSLRKDADPWMRAQLGLDAVLLEFSLLNPEGPGMKDVIIAEAQQGIVDRRKLEFYVPKLEPEPDSLAFMPLF